MMERTPESEAVLNVELEWSELEKASDRAYRKLVQKYNVPGFRRGHAPRAMLERMLGKDALYEEGLEDLVEESVRNAVREYHLRPLARPSVDTPPITHGQPYSFTARLPVLSPVELGDYKSIRVEQPAVEVSDEEIERVLENIRQDRGQWLPAERPAQIGNRVTMDLKLTSGDRTISDLHDNDFELASDRHGIYSGMDEQIAGMEVGQSREFTTTIPEDYANTELAGKEAHFAVTLKGVQFRELPALDDELARAIGYETLEAMRQAVREQLLERKRSQATREVRDKVAALATEQAKANVHPLLVDDEIHAMMREMERTLSQSRLSLERYLQATNKTEEQLHEELEPEARQRVKRDLVLSAVADAEEIDVTDQELEAWLALLSSVGEGRPLRLRQLNPEQREGVRSRLRREKAWDRLVEIATEGQEPSGAEAQSERNAQAAAGAATPEAATTPAPTPPAEGEGPPAPSPAEPSAAASPDVAAAAVPSGARADGAPTSAPAAGASAPTGARVKAAENESPASERRAASAETAASAGAQAETRLAESAVPRQERAPDTEVPDSPEEP